MLHYYGKKKSNNMNSKRIIQLSEILIIPIGVFLSLAIFSLTLGWNLLTMLLFWFLLIPFIAYRLPSLISKKDFNLKQSIIGLIIFYAFMVFMIYENFQTDYFILMMISLFSNIGIISFIAWIRK